MIAPMEKLFLVGPRRLASEILLRLQQVGVVQIETLRSDEIAGYQLSSEEKGRLRRWDEVALSADHSLRLLGLETDSSLEPLQGELDEVESVVLPLERRAAALVERKDQLEEELDLIDRYYEVATLLAELAQGLDESKRLAVLPFLLDKGEAISRLEKELGSILEDRFILSKRSVNGRLAVVLVVLKREAQKARAILSRLGLSELPRMGKYAEMNLRTMATLLAGRLKVVPEELARAEEELTRLAGEAAETVKGVHNRAKNEVMRVRVLNEMVSGRYGFGLFGWVPVRLENRVRQVMASFDRRAIFTLEPAQHHEFEHVPVLLENPGWITPFESLISFLSTPRYDSWDPTWVVAVFFPLWFGMIVGDMGYGLAFAAVYEYLARYAKRNQRLVLDFFKLRIPPEGVARIVAVLAPMTGWTLVWGFLYGEFFGNFFQRLGIFGTAQQPGLVRILIPRTDTVATANGLILVSIGFGVCQVLHGFFLKMSRTHRWGERKHFWEASGYFGGVAALVLFSYAFMTGTYRLWLIIPVALGAAVFLAGMVIARMPLMIAELPTQGGHILSYIRIYAVGLASAILANLTTDIGFTLYHLLGVAGFIAAVAVGVLMALLIHAVLLALLTVSHVLQPIRLIWVEFFTKFDFYTVSGRPYRPFKSIGSRETSDQ
jgi:V/A-type H+-transporting ATPase subunit I